MPLALGYQQARLDTRAGDLDAGRRQIAHYCDREGYALGEVFVEADLNHQCSALSALIHHAKARRPLIILVASENDLGVMPRVRQATRARIVRETGCPVMVASG